MKNNRSLRPIRPGLFLLFFFLPLGIATVLAGHCSVKMPVHSAEATQLRNFTHTARKWGCEIQDIDQRKISIGKIVVPEQFSVDGVQEVLNLLKSGKIKTLDLSKTNITHDQESKLIIPTLVEIGKIHWAVQQYPNVKADNSGQNKGSDKN